MSKRLTTYMSTKEAKAMLKKKGVKVLGYKMGARYLTSVALTEKARINSLKMREKHGITISDAINMVLENWS